MHAIFTSDDVGTGDQQSLDAFHTVTGWLESHGLRGTFFWIPKPGSPADEDPVWVPVLRAAAARGHDFQLHGLTHSTCLEFGVPQASTRVANPAPFEEYERHRDLWDRQHAAAALADRLTEGIERFERVFGRRPTVFRAPCFGMGATAYEALHAVGIHHSSSRGLNPTATAYTITKDANLRRWAPDYPCRPYVEPPGVTEYACFEDLTIAGVPAEEYDDRLDLYRCELGHFLSEAGEDGVLVFGTHFRSMYGSWEVVRPLFEAVIAWLAERGVGEWGTFGELIGPR